MKTKLLFGIAIGVLFFSILITCSREKAEKEAIEDTVVLKFLESKTFERTKRDLLCYGDISFSEIKSGIVNYDTIQISILCVPVYLKGKENGILEVVDLKSSNFLPNGDSYALNFVDLRDSNSSTLSGSVRMIDMNYENFEHSKLEIDNNLIKSWQCNNLPDDLVKKYSKLSNQNRLKSLKQKKLCDLNGDGNVSFTECYKCLSDAIDANGFSKFMCDIPFAGWTSCWYSKTAACLVISAMY